MLEVCLSICNNISNTVILWIPRTCRSSILWQYTITALFTRAETRSCWKNLLYQIDSYIADVHVTYSNSIVDKPIHDCFLLHFEIALPPNKIHKLSGLLLIFVTGQAASLYLLDVDFHHDNITSNLRFDEGTWRSS